MLDGPSDALLEATPSSNCRGGMDTVTPIFSGAVLSGLRFARGSCGTGNDGLRDCRIDGDLLSGCIVACGTQGVVPANDATREIINIMQDDVQTTRPLLALFVGSSFSSFRWDVRSSSNAQRPSLKASAVISQSGTGCRSRYLEEGTFNHTQDSAPIADLPCTELGTEATVPGTSRWRR